MDNRSLEVHDRLVRDLNFFMENAPLMIKDKGGKIAPLTMNREQLYVHRKLNKQLRETGKVRAIILKPRQRGMSTYIAARFFHRNVTRFGISTFILSHESATTDKLFKMVKRYFEHLSEPLKPPKRASSRKELAFDKLESEYAVGTAGNENVGRGGTIQLFHGSEVAFWSNTNEIKTGVMQSISNLDGTEIILESTANGLGNMFHQMTMDALNGESEYQVIFMPWFWALDYRQTPPSDFKLTEDEENIKKRFELEDDQIFWRRMKIRELGSLSLFKQEYPATIAEAFQSSGDSLIPHDKINDARKSKIKDKDAPLIMGVDPARSGDRTVIVFRRGREVPFYYTYKNMDSMLLAGIVGQMILKYSPARIFIDVGMGYGTLDRLRELGYGSLIEGVHFGSKALEFTIYMNRRAEMWVNMKKWFEDGDVNIPDTDEIHTDLACVPDFLRTSSGKIRLVGKDKIKEEYGMSPDIGDAMALTFASPVHPNYNREVKRNTKPRRKQSGLSTMRERR